jgi:hypothetical protein
VWQPGGISEENTQNILTEFMVSAMADTHNLKSLSETLNPFAPSGSVERKRQQNANKLEVQPQQHEYMVWPAKGLDRNEQLELQSQIHSATGGDEPLSVAGSEPEEILFWVIKATPNVAETIKNLFKVCFAL